MMLWLTTKGKNSYHLPNTPDPASFPKILKSQCKKYFIISFFFFKSGKIVKFREAKNFTQSNTGYKRQSCLLIQCLDLNNMLTLCYYSSTPWFSGVDLENSSSFMYPLMYYYDKIFKKDSMYFIQLKIVFWQLCHIHLKTGFDLEFSLSPPFCPPPSLCVCKWTFCTWTLYVGQMRIFNNH